MSAHTHKKKTTTTNATCQRRLHSTVVVSVVVRIIALGVGTRFPPPVGGVDTWARLVPMSPSLLLIVVLSPVLRFPLAASLLAITMGTEERNTEREDEEDDGGGGVN